MAKRYSSARLHVTLVMNLSIGDAQVQGDVPRESISWALGSMQRT